MDAWQKHKEASTANTWIFLIISLIGITATTLTLPLFFSAKTFLLILLISGMGIIVGAIISTIFTHEHQHVPLSGLILIATISFTASYTITIGSNNLGLPQQSPLLISILYTGALFLTILVNLSKTRGTAVQ